MVVRQFQLVESGPTFIPLRYGLLSAATLITDPDPHWQQGTVAQLDPCGIPMAVTGGPCSATGITKSPSVTGLGASAAEPFSIYAWVNCAPVGHGDELQDLRARTEQLLTNGEGRAVESVFWTGNTANGPPESIHPHLAADAALFSDAMGAQTVELQSAASVVTTGSPVSVVEGLALLEGALAECYGGEGVIHIPAAAVAHLSSMGVISRQGSQLRTLMGNVVAVYSSGNRQGPDGTEPATGQAWMYATGAVWIRRSPIKGLGQRPADFVGRADNSTVYVVERTYVVDWSCCHLAAQVNIPAVGAL
jgi:hypothetical protein